MFVGHTAVALAAKSKAKDVSLGWLLAAALALDILWPIFLLIGIEKVSIVPGATAFNSLVFDSYPWSHSLLMACVWGLCAMAIGRVRGVSTGVGFLIAAVVVSHWILDFVSHGPDLPLWPGHSPLVGLGLWNSVAATYVVEGIIFAVGIFVYAHSTRAVDRIGSIGLWAFLLASAAMWVASPWAPPPNERALAWSAHGVWLLVLWAWWVDRHREPSRR